MARIAYFFSTFPALTTTFIQREVNEILNSGLDILLSAIRPPAPGRFHPDDKKFLAKTFYLTPVKTVRYFIANLKWFAKSPTRYFRVIKLALSLKDSFPWQRVRNLIHLAGAAVLAEYLVKNQVVHIHVHFAYGAASIAIFLEALTGIPYSLTIHGSDVLLPNPLTEEKLKRAKFVISNCRFHIDNLRKRFCALSKQKFHIVRLGVELHSGPWSRIKPPEKDPKLRILNVARLVAVKAQDVLIAACAGLRDEGVNFKCRIVGDGPKREELNRLIDDLGLKEYVELMGSRYEAEVIDLYDWSHVVVLSSLSEGTPMTIIEAMAKGRPVVAPNITALPEMVIEGQSGFLFEPGSVKNLAAKLAKLALHPQLITVMGNTGYLQAQELFDIEANIHKLLDILRDEVPPYP
jgi:glycosyltransferase involved in cell wall biosynthesis